MPMVFLGPTPILLPCRPPPPHQNPWCSSPSTRTHTFRISLHVTRFQFWHLFRTPLPQTER